jgi:hypothetical protein
MKLMKDCITPSGQMYAQKNRPQIGVRSNMTRNANVKEGRNESGVFGQKSKYAAAIMATAAHEIRTLAVLLI